MGFPDVLWIRALYLNSETYVVSNRVICSLFPVLRVTRQVCPFSPLLFDLLSSSSHRSSFMISVFSLSDSFYKAGMANSSPGVLQSSLVFRMSLMNIHEIDLHIGAQHALAARNILSCP